MTEEEALSRIVEGIESLREGISNNLLFDIPGMTCKVENRTPRHFLAYSHISISRNGVAREPVDISLAIRRHGENFIASMDICRESGEILIDGPDVNLGAEVESNQLERLFDELSRMIESGGKLIRDYAMGLI